MTKLERLKTENRLAKLQVNGKENGKICAKLKRKLVKEK